MNWTLVLWRCGLPLLLNLSLWTRCSEAIGQWVYLSRFLPSPAPSSHSLNASSSSSSPRIDSCVTDIQYITLNVSTDGVRQRKVHFRAAEKLSPVRPLDGNSYSGVFVTPDPRIGCVTRDNGSAIKVDVEGKFLVQVVQCYRDADNDNETVCRQCCQHPTKAAVAVDLRAAGFISIFQRPSASAIPTTLPNLTTYCSGYTDKSGDELKTSYDIDVVYADDNGDGTFDWLLGGKNVVDGGAERKGDNNASSSPLVVVWDRRFFPWELIFDWLLIGTVATFSMTVSAYAGGLLSYRLYREKFVKRIRKMAKKLAHLRTEGGEAVSLGDETKDGDRKSESSFSMPDLIGGLIAFVFISSLLVLLYFVKWIAVPIFLVIYAMSSLSLFTLTRPLIDRLPFGTRRINCVMHWPCGFVRRCFGPCCDRQIREILAAIVFLTLGWTWYFLRHDKIVILTLHNFLGFSLVYHVSNGIRLTRFQACVYPSVLLLIYDVFMVFITPFMTAGGMSVMESVARGTEGDDLPLVFKIPALFPSTENHCSRREVAGLLGFGDVVLPAILASYMVLAGFVLEKPKLYISTTLLSYPLSLVVTIISLYFMQVAQPALLYIVPIMMLAIIITAGCAGDLKTLWKFDLMNYPDKISLERLREEMKALNLDAEDEENGEREANVQLANGLEEGTTLEAPQLANGSAPYGTFADDNNDPNRGEPKDTSSLIRRNVTDGGADDVA